MLVMRVKIWFLLRGRLTTAGDKALPSKASIAEVWLLLPDVICLSLSDPYTSYTCVEILLGCDTCYHARHFFKTWILRLKLRSLDLHSQPITDYLLNLIFMHVVTGSSLKIWSRLPTSSESTQTGIRFFSETFKFHNVILGQIELYRTYHPCYKTQRFSSWA